LTKFENDSNYNCEITLDNDKQYLVYGNWIHNNKLDQWAGWSCSAGHTRFYIDKDFEIWSGECKNDYLGNVLTDWNIKTDTQCKRDSCTGCTDDLITEKSKNA
jgi:hypothetical protein